MIRRLSVMALALGLAAAAPALVAGSARVVDGDTFSVGPERVRLWGVDAPEGRQVCQNAQGQGYACGDVARDQLVGLIGGRAVRCEVRDRDPYGRAVARCLADRPIWARQWLERGGRSTMSSSAAAPMRRPRPRREGRGAVCGLVASRPLRPGGPKRAKRARRRSHPLSRVASSRATSTPRVGGSSMSRVRRTMRRPVSTHRMESAGSVQRLKHGRPVGRPLLDDRRVKAWQRHFAADPAHVRFSTLMLSRSFGKPRISMASTSLIMPSATR